MQTEAMDKKEFSWSKISQIFKNFGGGMPPLPSIIPVQSANLQTIPDKPDSEDVSTLESDLLEIGQSAIRASQLQGYFPLGYAKDSPRLSLNPKSFPFLWTIFILTFQIFTSSLWYFIILSFTDLYENLRVVSATEKLAISASAAFISIVVLGRRLYGFLGYKQTLGFWSEFLQGIKKIEGNPHHGKGVLKSPVFLWIKTSIDRTVLENLAVTTLFGLYFLVTVIVRNLRGFGAKWSTPFFIGYTTCSVFWNVMGCAHVFITAWTTFPLKIIQGLLETLREELDLVIFLRSTKLREGWIEDYHRIESLLRLYTAHFEKSLMVEIAYNSIQILCQFFSAFSWILAGMFASSLSRCIPILFALRTIFQLANEAGRVIELHGEIYGKLCRVEADLEDDVMKRKVNSLIKEMTLNHLTVRPGRYFTLNRSLITSIMSTITTFVVVLIQFRDGEKV